MTDAKGRRNFLGVEVDLIREEIFLRQLRESLAVYDDEEMHAFYPPLLSKQAEQLNILGNTVMERVEAQARRATKVFGVSLKEGRQIMQHLESLTSQEQDEVEVPEIQSISEDSFLNYGHFQPNVSPDSFMLNSPKTSLDEAVFSSGEVSSTDEIEYNFPEESTSIEWLRQLQLSTAARKSIQTKVLAQKVRAANKEAALNVNKNAPKGVRFRAQCINNFDVLPPENRSYAKPPWVLDVCDVVGKAAFEYDFFHKSLLPEEFQKSTSAVYTSIQFQLPIDLHDLEDMSVVDYLRSHCKIFNNRHLVYENLFNQMDIKDRREPKNMIKNCALKLVFYYADAKQIEDILQLLDLPDDYEINSSDFRLFMALIDRLFTVNIEEVGPERWNYQAGILERIDMLNLSKTISHYRLRPNLAMLLDHLGRQSDTTDFLASKQHLSNKSSKQKVIKFCK